MIHGTLGIVEDHPEPVHGIENINQMILSIDFKDSHTKICQVDSLETLEKGVLVQVTGELSTNGQPMRRFLQSFVLAPRTPTNYYVRNDIFRYLDQVFDEDDMIDSEPVRQHVSVGINSNAVPVVQPQVPVVASPVSVVDPSPKQVRPMVFPVSSDKVNGHPEKLSVSEPESPPPASVAKVEPVETPVVEPVVSKPVSWADRVSVGNNQLHVMQPPPPASKNLDVMSPHPPSTGATSPAGNKISPGKDKGGKTVVPLTPRGKKQDRDAPPTFEADVVGDENKKTYADEQQVFVGNLPLDISEDELRNFFATYGKIADVRVNRNNQGPRNLPGRTPNYGFITFESAESVKVLLSKKVSLAITLII